MRPSGDDVLEQTRWMLVQGLDELRVRGFIEGVQFVVEGMAPR